MISISKTRFAYFLERTALLGAAVEAQQAHRGQQGSAVSDDRCLGGRQVDRGREQQPLGGHRVGIGAIAQALERDPFVGGVLIDEDQLVIGLADEIGAIELAQEAERGEEAGVGGRFRARARARARARFRYRRPYRSAGDAGSDPIPWRGLAGDQAELL